MRRRSPIISLPSLLIFAVLLAALGLTVWRQGGLAFSPGSLSAGEVPGTSLAGYSSHAEFEEKCGLCHQPLTSLQAELCIACHSNIDEQIIEQDSLHGKIEGVMMCAECHTDHKGREHDLRLGSLEDFDHSGMAFSLIRHQVDYSLESLDCLTCHVPDGQFSVLDSSCTRCHAGADPAFMLTHVIDFGEDCVSCHDGLDSMARFEHASSLFPLEGVHQELACVECHVQGQFEDLSTECVACHIEPFEHQGWFGLDCASCHNPQDWKPAQLNGQLFDHSTGTEFSLELHRLDFAGNPISCQGCHLQDDHTLTPGTCFECHSSQNQDFMVQHQAELGTNCLECHDGVDRMRDFDHQELFPLDGAHAEIECQACHVDQVYQETPSECKDCHPEPEIHAGFFGFKCEYCHQATKWVPAQLHSHGFPINHGEQPGDDCQLCHVSSYEQYTCYACHEHDQEEIFEKHEELNLSQKQLQNCTDCHMDGLVHDLENQ